MSSSTDIASSSRLEAISTSNNLLALRSTRSRHSTRSMSSVIADPASTRVCLINYEDSHRRRWSSVATFRYVYVALWWINESIRYLLGDLGAGEQIVFTSFTTNGLNVGRHLHLQEPQSGIRLSEGRQIAAQCRFDADLTILRLIFSALRLLEAQLGAICE